MDGIQSFTYDNINKNLSDDVSDISWVPEKKATLSEDSANVSMAYYFTSHGNFQAGADAGCVHCNELVDKGK